MIELVRGRELRGEAMAAAMDQVPGLGFPNSGIAARANVIQLGKAIGLAPDTIDQLEAGIFAEPIIGFSVPSGSFAMCEADFFWRMMRHMWGSCIENWLVKKEEFWNRSSLKEYSYSNSSYSYSNWSGVKYSSSLDSSLVGVSGVTGVLLNDFPSVVDAAFVEQFSRGLL
jgi:hypothetical protein